MTDPTQGFITFEERPEGVGAVPRLQERGVLKETSPVQAALVPEPGVNCGCSAL